ncbi:hypothetical protein EDB89DRAFT_1906766 [Lactarius sanguifluus]|nr:hypothetical protein EDB89DRAFT_1906766 [Lactarius sanguifluus]
MTTTTSLVMKTWLVTSWDKSQPLQSPSIATSPPPPTIHKPWLPPPLQLPVNCLNQATHRDTGPGGPLLQVPPQHHPQATSRYSRVPLPPPATRKPVAATTTLLPQLGDSPRRQHNTIATHTSAAQQVPQLQLHNHDSPRQPTQGAGPCNTTPMQQARATPQPRPTAHKPI